jgi:RNA polymerase primary sigma factor
MPQTDPPLTRYLNEINEYPKLDKDDEITLAQKILQGDQQSLDTLVKANLRYVVIIAKKYLSSGLTLADLINEGTIGLIEAAKRFKSEKGVRFITYAVWWIRQAILYAIETKASLVKLPPKQANMLNMINKHAQILAQIYGREPSISEIADKAGMKETEVENLLGLPRYLFPVEASTEESDTNGTVMEIPDDNSYLAEDLVIEDAFVDDLELLMACLDQREKEILKLHYGFDGTPLTLQQIGDRFNLTRERIRQIEQKALRKLKRIAASRNLQEYLNK